jgi:TPR repeat protein
MMAAMRLRSCLFLALALPFQAVAAPAVVSLDRVAQAPEAAWEEFLRSSDFDRAYSAYAVLEKVGYTYEGVDGGACGEHHAELDDAVAKAPVSVAVLHGALLCAESTGETEKAEQLEKALLALSKEALKNGRQQPWPKPIRVLGPTDVYALLNMAGLESRYEYFELVRPNRYYPLIVAAWDKETGKEIHQVFDYVAPVAALKGTNDFVGYPHYRHLLTNFYVDAQATRNQLAAVDLQAVIAATKTADPQAKVKALRISAGYGGIQSLRVWATICATAPFDDCSDELSDILIGLSEKKQAVPMTLLAFVHAEGIGVKRDTALADQLLLAAMRLWTEEGVALEYIELAELAGRPGAVDRKVLAAAMQKPAVLAARAARRIAKKEKTLSEQERQALSAPASNAMGTGQSWLSEHWRQLEKEDLRVKAMRLAAEAGDVHAQRTYAYHLLQADPQRVDHGQVQHWMREAAFGGDASAMEYLSQQAAIRHEWKAAERWLMAAVASGDIEAMLALARLYEQDHSDVGQTVKQAFEWYVTLAGPDNIPEARRRAARLAIQGKGTPKDPARALQWLLQDAEAGDTTSQMQLAIGYLDGDFGAEQHKSAQPWIDRVMAADDNEPKMSYAGWLFRRSNTPEGRARGVRILEQLREAGEPWGTNNLAWALCTAPDASARDVKRGMELSEAILKEPEPSAAWLDTVAACQAAAEDYPRAVETQQRAISKFVAYWGPGTDIYESEDDDGYVSRLKLYQSNKPYIDKHAAGPDS